MKPAPSEYSRMADKASPGSKYVKNAFMAFLFGGLFCTAGQILFGLYSQAGLEEKSARAVVSVTLVFLGALLTALGVYDNIAVRAGAGSIVPITGFANSRVSPAMEFKSEGHIMGIGAKMFTIAGPVLVFGITASVVYGAVLWILGLF